MRFPKALFVCAAAALAAQPCLAAEIVGPDGDVERRSAAFAGASLSVPIGGAGRERAPSARLQLGMTHDLRGTNGERRRLRAGLVELGLGRSGQPAYFVGGRDVDEIGERLNVKGKTTTLLIVGGVLVLGVVILAAVASAQPTPGPHEGTFD